MLRRVDRIRYEEIREDLLEHTTRRRVGAATYVAQRQEQGASNATVNRELATLGPMMRLVYKHDKAARLLMVDRLKESAPRAGFFEEEQYRAVLRHLPADLQVVAAIAYRFGWRARSEILPLERRHLDLEQGTLTLDPGMTKNDDARKVYLTPDLKAVLEAQLGRVDELQRQIAKGRGATSPGSSRPYLFPHLTGKRAETSRTAFYKAWRTACRRAGVPGMLTHDFRRTAVRNMERTGIPRSVATKLTGHRTEAVYRRYAIVSDADLRAASLRLSAHGTMGVDAVL